jgi:hypothetical protein
MSIPNRGGKNSAAAGLERITDAVVIFAAAVARSNEVLKCKTDRRNVRPRFRLISPAGVNQFL